MLSEVLHEHHRDEGLPGARGHESEGVSQDSLLHDAPLVQARGDRHQLGVVQGEVGGHGSAVREEGRSFDPVSLALATLECLQTCMVAC